MIAERLFGEPDDGLQGLAAALSSLADASDLSGDDPAAGPPVRPHHARHVGLLQPANAPASPRTSARAVGVGKLFGIPTLASA